MAKSLSRDDFIAAGAKIVSESGLDALTTRALGESLGVHSTAVYRHFPDTDGLVLAITDAIVGEAAAAIVSHASEFANPRDRLAVFARMTRASVRARPDLARMLITVLEADTVVPTPNIDAYMRMVIDELRAMGLTGADLVNGHQAYESLVSGTIFADYLGAPNHLEHRLVRRRMLGAPGVSTFATDAAEIQEINDAAFEILLDGLLDALNTLATRSNH